MPLLQLCAEPCRAAGTSTGPPVAQKDHLFPRESTGLSDEKEARSRLPVRIQSDTLMVCLTRHFGQDCYMHTPMCGPNNYFIFLLGSKFMLVNL